MTTFANQVYRLVSRCPRGKVVSYGGIAAMLGKPRAARAVGTALRQLPSGLKVPWWRVINSSGEVSIREPSNARPMQRSLLQREGVKFNKAGRVDWELFGWNGK